MRHSILHAALDRLIPAPCPGCGLPGLGAVFCDGCAAEWLLQSGAHCTACGRTLNTHRQPEVSEPLCNDCRAIPPLCRRLYYVADYAGPHAALIRRFKYRKDLTLIRPLARLLAERLREHAAAFDTITWMPLHPARQKQRGFNQAELLARAVGRDLRTPVRNLLERPMATPPLEGMSRAERLGTLEQAIQPKRPTGGLCLVIDDVYTTGASLTSAAAALSAAGATEVRAGVLARTPLTEDSQNSWMSRAFDGIPGEAPAPDTLQHSANRP